jgi:hypothetical protein
MEKSLERQIRQRANGLCEYCRMPESASKLKFTIDHVIARQHGGDESSENLALACGFCNRHKGPNIAGIDPISGNLVRLFHPRRDIWQDHFRWDRALLIGLTPVGRATVAILAINQPYQIAVRQALISESRFPPP